MKLNNKAKALLKKGTSAQEESNESSSTIQDPDDKLVAELLQFRERLQSVNVHPYEKSLEDQKEDEQIQSTKSKK